MTDPNREFREALRKVGAGLKKNGSWLLDFSKQELVGADDRHSKAREDLWQCLLALAILATRNEENESDLGRALNNEEARLWRDANKLRQPFRFDPVDEPIEKNWKYQAWWGSVVQIQRTITNLLAKFLAEGSIAIPIQDAQYLVSRGAKGRLRFPLRQIAIGQEESRSGVESAVLFRLGQILGGFGHRLRQCRGKGCSKGIFIGGRSDQRFCSRQCQMRHLMRTKRAAVGPVTRRRQP